KWSPSWRKPDFAEGVGWPRLAAANNVKEIANVLPETTCCARFAYPLLRPPPRFSAYRAWRHARVFGRVRPSGQRPRSHSRGGGGRVPRRSGRRARELAGL